MATTGPGTTALVPGPQIHQLQGQRLLIFIPIAIVLITTSSTFIVHRIHLTSDLIAVQDQKLTGQQQCNTQTYFYAPQPVLQSAIMDLFSSKSGFFVGRRHQLVQSHTLSSSSPSFRHLLRKLFSCIVIPPLSISSQSKPAVNRTAAVHYSK